MIPTKQEILNELSNLYRLQEEGKKVKRLIQELEEELCKVCDDEMDSKKTNEKNQKGW